MKERPILFNDQMVRAILAGQKTQTRRVIKPQPYCDIKGAYFDAYNGGPQWNWWTPDNRVCNGHTIVKCPYGVPGDRLWVKETWRIGAWKENGAMIAVDYRANNHSRREWLDVPDEEMFERLWQQSTDDAIAAGCELDGDDQYHWDHGQSPCRWRSPRFMPRWASRITLKIVDIRVEQIQDISVEDIWAEGIDNGRTNKTMGKRHMNAQKMAFEKLWNSINAGRAFGWLDNLRVWVIELQREKP